MNRKEIIDKYCIDNDEDYPITVNVMYYINVASKIGRIASKYTDKKGQAISTMSRIGRRFFFKNTDSAKKFVNEMKSTFSGDKRVIVGVIDGQDKAAAPGKSNAENSLKNKPVGFSFGRRRPAIN